MAAPYPDQSVTLAQRFNDFDNSIVRYQHRRNAEHQPSSTSKCQPNRAVTRGLSSFVGLLGRLKSLPMELLFQIINQLDLPTLIALRDADPSIAAALKGSHKYAILQKNAINALRTLSDPRGKCPWSLEQLFDVLTRSSRCAGCNGFGAYLYIPTFERVCQGCAESNILFLPIEVHAASYHGVLTDAQIERIPKKWTIIPGSCNPILRPVESTNLEVTVVSWKAVVSMRGDRVFYMYSRNRDHNFFLRWMSIVELPYFAETSGQIEFGIRCPGCEVEKNKHEAADIPIELGFWRDYYVCRQCRKDEEMRRGVYNTGRQIPR
ncbi:MAG: hypothetical protein Q9225_007271 [Loekoesia sp. 1 TL-2023]